MKAFCTCISLILLLQTTLAQEYTAFTVNDGLPSNHVYQCIEDDHGFLWIATDAGIARFDGRYFQVFTTEHGLPDNEVLQIAKENDGTIWINCFKQGPAYFDEVRNRFISSKEDSTLKMFGTTGMILFALPNGGVRYQNENGSTIFINKKVSERHDYDRRNQIYISTTKTGSVLWWRSLNKRSYIGETLDGENIDSVETNRHHVGYYFLLFDNNRFFVYKKNDNYLLIYSGFKTDPLRFKTDTIKTLEPFFHLSFTRSKFYVITNSGKVYVYEKSNGKLDNIYSGAYLPNGYYNDSKENTWISTIDKGLLVYRKKQMASIEMPAGFSRTNFISLATKGSSLLAGNYYGEVIEITKRKIIKHEVIKKTPSRQRKIIIAANQVYTISEDGIFLNYKRAVAYPAGKTGLLYNDSILIVGSSGGIVIINTRTNKTINSFRYKRVTALTKTEDGLIYMGSTDGLHTYNYNNNKFTSLASLNPLLANRIAALCITPDGIVWAATSGNGVVAIKNGMVLSAIDNTQGIISKACRTISSGKPGEVWLGTAQGLSIITYKLDNNTIGYSIQNLSINDGLKSNEINDLLYVNDTMYVATGSGLSVIPPHFDLPKFNIPVKLVRISINQRDTMITTHYHLTHEQQDIAMQFAAIELNGHFRNLQYSIDESKGWIDLPGRTLTLQLNSGLHKIRVRAVDVNGNSGNDILFVEFKIDTPFWKTFWFWLIVIGIIQLLIIYIITRRIRKRKEAKIVKEMAVLQTASLEQQAFTSLMNPHFMFNALNSIQHYINVQDRYKANHYLSDFASLIRKNFEAAHQSFIPLDQEIENIKIYLRLEQMRFTDKFSYSINIADNLDVEGWMIPTMIIQPLLENAVLHGIMPSHTTGEIEIVMKEENNHLHISIKDNGIGIDNSRSMKRNTGRRSRGMELISKRIKALSHFSSDTISLYMEPASDSVSNPGNITRIILPSALYDAWLKAQKKSGYSNTQ